jgi:PAS domain S-box-containing protein
MPIAGNPAHCDAFDELPVPYLELDARGIITRANRAALTQHPSERGTLIGQSAWHFLTPDEKELSFAAYAKLIQSGAQPPVVLRSLYDRSGEFRTYEFHRNFIVGADGAPCGMRLVGLDITDSQRAMENSRRQLTRLSAVFACLAEPLIVTDALGFIGMVNPACESLLRQSASDLVGKSIEEGLPLAPSSASESSRDFLHDLTQPRRSLTTVLASDGRVLPLEISSSPLIQDSSGLTSGIVMLLHSVEY